MGFTDSDLGHITREHLLNIGDALDSIKDVAESFIQYGEPDERLVDAILRQLVSVQGFRRVAILYRDTDNERSLRASTERPQVRKRRFTGLP